MRTRNALALGAAAALIASALISGSAAIAARTPRPPVPATFAAPSASAASAAPAEDRSGDRPADRAPTCGKASDPAFPIRTRIHGGPTTVRSGSGFHPWSVDLTNTTRETCHRIHPVIVLTAQDRGLTEDRVTLEFHDEDADRWRPVVLEETTEDEIVGVFDGFQGFAVPAGGTVTVRTRLSLAAGTPSNTVTVNAAVVQRKGDDGDWVGESGDYRFTVVAGEGGPVLRAHPRPAHRGPVTQRVAGRGHARQCVTEPVRPARHHRVRTAHPDRRRGRRRDPVGRRSPGAPHPPPARPAAQALTRPGARTAPTPFRPASRQDGRRRTTDRDGHLPGRVKIQTS
ncbi:UNVERIFIED_CONTAM: hypothetical protein RKD43_002488 [Streptomyces graminofaciens]